MWSVSHTWIAAAFWRLRFQFFFFFTTLRNAPSHLSVDPVHYARDPLPLDQQNKWWTVLTSGSCALFTGLTNLFFHTNFH